MSPNIFKWVVLEEKVVLAFEINQPVGVIHPIALGCEMELWS